MADGRAISADVPTPSMLRGKDPPATLVSAPVEMVYCWIPLVSAISKTPAMGRNATASGLEKELLTVTFGPPPRGMEEMVFPPLQK
jgi:hypothetical protein